MSTRNVFLRLFIINTILYCIFNLMFDLYDGTEIDVLRSIVISIIFGFFVSLVIAKMHDINSKEH